MSYAQPIPITDGTDGARQWRFDGELRRALQLQPGGDDAKPAQIAHVSLHEQGQARPHALDDEAAAVGALSARRNADANGAENVGGADPGAHPSVHSLSVAVSRRDRVAVSANQ